MIRALAFTLALFAAAPMITADAQPRTPAAQPAQHGVPVQRVVSPGGIEAWLVSDSTVPMIVLQAYWKGGSAIEPGAMIGVTGVMTEMLTEGSGDLDANAFKERLQDLNMSVGYGAGWDGIGMSMTTLSANRDAAFAMTRMTLMQPRWDAAPLERVRRQMQVGLRTRETNPSYIANLALDGVLHPGHPYARRTSAASVAAINRAGMQERMRTLLVRDRMQITVVGDIDAATLGRLLDETFGGLPRSTGALPAPPVVQPPATAQPMIVRALPQPQSLILFAAPGIQDEDPDWVPLTVANYILGGGGFSSRLTDAVREQRGLVYGIGTGPSVRDYSAFIRGSAQTENGDVREAIEVTRAEMQRLYTEGATQAEVNDAITYLTGSFALDLDSNVKIANVVHSYQVAGRSIDYINERNARIRAVTRDDVNRVIRRLFNPEVYTFVVVGQPEGLPPTP